MAKEKKRLIDEKEQQETIFYYEIIGSIIIILSVTILGKLGKIGSIFTTFFKVCFGDWYWFILLLIMFIGFFSLFMHRKFDFKNQRFIGIIFIIFSILTFSHFPIHSYISQNSTSYFSETWSLYRQFINTNESTSLGGGMIGGLLFYAVYYLLGSVGVVLLACILIVLGLSLLFNKPLLELVSFVWNRMKNGLKYTKSFNHFFKYEVGNYEKNKDKASKNGKDLEEKDIDDNENKTKEFKNIKIPLKLFSEYDNYYNKEYQKGLANEYLKLILEAIDSYKIKYDNYHYIHSYYVTTYFIKIDTITTDISNINMMSLFKTIKSNIKEEVLFSYDSEIIIQISNKYQQILSLKELLIINEKKDERDESIYNIPIGIDFLNESLDINILNKTNILLIGDKGTGIRNFIKSFLLLLFSKKSINEYELYLYDSLNDFNDIDSFFISVEEDIYSFFDEIKIIIEERIKKLNQCKVNSFQEYLKMSEINEMPFIINKGVIIINEVVNMNDLSKYLENKLLYITQLSKKVGLTLIYIVRNETQINNVINSIFSEKILFKCSKEMLFNSNEYLASSKYLAGFGDSFYVSQNRMTRFISPLIYNDELNKVINYLIK